jgi:hypothetical protein
MHILKEIAPALRVGLRRSRQALERRPVGVGGFQIAGVLFVPHALLV